MQNIRNEKKEPNGFAVAGNLRGGFINAAIY
jgi:hypothetical protein